MIVTIAEQGNVKLIGLDGRLDGTTSRQVETEFLKLTDQGEKTFVFDLSKLEYISSAGLRVMLLGAKKTRAAGGKIALCRLNDSVNEVFQISGFHTIFAIYSTHEEALAHVSS